MKTDIVKIFFSNFIKMISTILVTFILPKILSYDDYAGIKLYQLYISYIGVFSLGYNDGIFLKYGGKEFDTINKSEVAREQRTIVIYQIVVTIILIIVSIVLRDFIVMVWALSFLPITMYTYYTYMYQATGEFSKYANITNISSVSTLVINLCLLFIWKQRSFKYFILFYCLINYVVFVVSLLKFNMQLKIVKGSFSVTLLFSMIRSGILLMIGNFVYIFFSGLDKWFVKQLFGMEQFAIYSFAAQLLAVINMFITPISLTLYSYFSKNKDFELERRLRELILIFLLGLINFAFVFKYIIINYIQKYVVAVDIIIILFLSQIFLTLNIAVYVNLFKVYHMQKQYFRNLCITVILSIIFNICGYKMINDLKGIALATLICMLIWTMLNINEFKHTRLKKWELLYLVGCLLVFVAVNKFVSPIIGLIVYSGCYLGMSFLFRKNNLIYITMLFRHG